MPVGGHKVRRAARSRAHRLDSSSFSPSHCLKVHRAAQHFTQVSNSSLIPLLLTRSTAPSGARRWSAPHPATIPAPWGLSPWTGEAKVRPCARDARTSSTASRILGQAGRRTNPFHPSRATTSSPPSTRPGPPTACAASPTAGKGIWSSSPSKHWGMPRRNSSRRGPRAALIMPCAEPGGGTACSAKSRCVPSGKTPSRSCSATSPPNWIARIWPIRATPSRWRRRPGRMGPWISTSPWPAGTAAIGITCTSSR